PTHVVCATDGRGGESGDVTGADTPDQLAQVRIAELRCATDALGANTLTLLGYEDPIMGADGAELFGFAADEATLDAQIADAIQQSGAEIVLTHGSDGEYGHPAHIQLHRAVLRAVRAHNLPVTVYGIAAHVPTVTDRLWNASDPAHVALDISPWQATKLDAMACHRTQHALFKRRRKLTHIRQALRVTESVHQHFPPLADGATPDDAFMALLLAAGGWRPG
ncbi:MAG: PIG-L family deacetylase, partial [Anaerolineae bacterium]|nr:PIG-L family deacetylase [Anaerolineae bacterium]